MADLVGSGLPSSGGEAPHEFDGAAMGPSTGDGSVARAFKGAEPSTRVMKFIDKQMMWDAAKQRKQHDVAVKMNSKENEQCTFAPTLISRKRDKHGSAPADGDASGEAQPRHLGRESPFNHHIARLERARRAREEQKAAIQIRVEGFYRPRSKSRNPSAGGASPDRRELKQKPLALSDPEDPPLEHDGAVEGWELDPNLGPSAQYEMDEQLETPDEQKSELQRRPQHRQHQHMQPSRNAPAPSGRPDAKVPPEPQIHKWLLETSRYDDEEPLSEDPDETFFEQLQRERRQWARERSRMLRVIELQQKELKKRGDGVEARAIDIANTFSAAVTTFEQRIINMESRVESELSGLRKDVQKSMETAQESKPNGGVSTTRLNRLEEQLASIASHVKVLAQAPTGQAATQGKRTGSR